MSTRNNPRTQMPRRRQFDQSSFQPLPPAQVIGTPDPSPVETIPEPPTPRPAAAPSAEAVPTSTTGATKKAPKKERRAKPTAPDEGSSLDLSEILAAAGMGEWSSMPLPDATIHLNARRNQRALYLPEKLIELLDAIRPVWVMRNSDWGRLHGMPGKSAWREGLMRLALLHVNDAELFTLIPRDGRRAGTPTEATLPAFDPPTPGALPPLPFTIGFDDTRLVDDGRYPKDLFADLSTIAHQWAFSHPVWLTTKGGAPGAAAWREGLIRLGLKHINDPQLAGLIPPLR